MKEDIEKTIVVNKLRASSIYKLLLYGLLISLLPLGVIFGITGFFGSDTVKWNNQPIHGIAALFAGPAISTFIALFFTGIAGSFCCLGLWVLSRFQKISIKIVVAAAD